MTKPKRRYAAASDELHRALVALAAQGQRTPCAERSGYLWLADDVEDRALAARLCNGCLVLAECHDAAEEMGERFGVWGGKDRTRPKRAGQESDAA